MKRIIFGCIVFVAVAVALIFFLLKSTTPPVSQLAPNESANSSASSAPLPHSGSSNSVGSNSLPPPPESLAARAGRRGPETNAAVDLSPEIILQNVRHAIHEYGEMFDGNPVGTNPEITAALSGKNPKQINFLHGVPGIRIDQDGAMIDSWGTPYFFHQLSGTEMEIHSAGPDKIMWTSDDLVTR